MPQVEAQSGCPFDVVICAIMSFIEYSDGDRRRGRKGGSVHENLWAGVGLKVEHAGFFLRQMQAALDRPRGQRAAMLEAAGATVDIQWQPAFYANLDAFLVMARSVPEVINSCFGKDTANKEMRNWFAALSPDEQKRRADFLTAFENGYDAFRNLPLSKARNISVHRAGYPPGVEARIVGSFGVSYIGSPVKRVPTVESRPPSPGDDPNDPAVIWASTLPPVSVRPTWTDFEIDGKPLFPECGAHLQQVEALVAEARAIAERVHGTDVLTAPP
jgi:hypothetical protein